MNIEFPLFHETHDRNYEILERIYIVRRFGQNVCGAAPNASKNSLNCVPKWPVRGQMLKYDC
jgi:hypothetical protein